MEIRIPHAPAKRTKNYAFYVLIASVVLVFFVGTLRNRASTLEPSAPPVEKVMTSFSPDQTLQKKIVYERVDDAKVLRYAAYWSSEGDGRAEKEPITIWDWATSLAKGDDTARSMASELIELLQNTPFDAFRFETKGCTLTNAKSKGFEFALVNDSFLYSFAKDADYSAFAEHFEATTQEHPAAAVFENLGGSALLIAPKPWSVDTRNSVAETYGHLGNFVRKASQKQVEPTWCLVARTFLERLQAVEPKTVWFSTAGTGIAWLHFRFDRRPKYYRYVTFANET